MARLNNWIKAIVLHSNTIFSLAGTAFVGLAIFILVSDWGSIDASFFVGWSIVAILFGVFLFLTSSLAYLGIRYQSRRTGCWTGRRILAFYMIVLLLSLVAELYVIVKLATAVDSLQTSLDAVDADPNAVVPYESVEKSVASRFNDFYFGATDGCYDPKFVFFWSWVDGHCPEGMSSDRCISCGSYSVTSCQADEPACAASPDETGIHCAYELCRQGVLDYLISRAKPVYLYGLAFTAFHVILLLLSCSLMCFTQRDTLETMLIKTGTISQDAAVAARQRRVAAPAASSNNSGATATAAALAPEGNEKPRTSNTSSNASASSGAASRRASGR